MYKDESKMLCSVDIFSEAGEQENTYVQVPQYVSEFSEIFLIELALQFKCIVIEFGLCHGGAAFSLPVGGRWGPLAFASIPWYSSEICFTNTYHDHRYPHLSPTSYHSCEETEFVRLPLASSRTS